MFDYVVFSNINFTFKPAFDLFSMRGFVEFDAKSSEFFCTHVFDEIFQETLDLFKAYGVVAGLERS